MAWVLDPPDSPSPIAGNYTDEDRLNKWEGSVNTALQSDLNSQYSTPTIDTTILLNAIQQGENYIDSRLTSIGFTTPLTGMDTRTARLMEDLANHATRWQLADGRNYGLFTRQQMSAVDEAKTGYYDKKYVDEWLDRIAGDPSILVTMGAPTTGSEDTLGDLIAGADLSVVTDCDVLQSRRLNSCWWEKCL